MQRLKAKGESLGREKYGRNGSLAYTLVFHDGVTVLPELTNLEQKRWFSITRCDYRLMVWSC